MQTKAVHSSLDSELPQSTNIPIRQQEGPVVRLSELESLCVGAIGGTLETLIQMPLVTWKICIQEGRPYPTVIREWYRGVVIMAGSLAPITAVQCFANSMFQSMLFLRKQNGRSSVNNEPEDWELLVCSGAAGTLSAFVNCPSDLLTIQQQKMHASLLGAFNTIRTEYGWMRVYRGITPTCLRESVYSMGYLGLAPVIRGHLISEQHTSDVMTDSSLFTRYPGLTTVVSAMIGGTLASVITHPIDTVKTCIQSDLEGVTYSNIRRVMPMLIQRGGISALFKGLVPRSLRTCGAFVVINQVRQTGEQVKRRRLECKEDSQFD